LSEEALVDILLLIVVLLLLFGGLGAAPTWGYSSQWGWGPSGVIWVVLLVLVLVYFLIPSRAHAGEISPLAWRCAELYTARNDFYNSRGLCFTRNKAKEYYPGNESTCTIKHGSDFPISAREKRVVDSIVAQERALGCPKL
jgi:hypothetical protein